MRSQRRLVTPQISKEVYRPSRRPSSAASLVLQSGQDHYYSTLPHPKILPAGAHKQFLRMVFPPNVVFFLKQLPFFSPTQFCIPREKQDCPSLQAIKPTAKSFSPKVANLCKTVLPLAFPLLTHVSTNPRISPSSLFRASLFYGKRPKCSELVLFQTHRDANFSLPHALQSFDRFYGPWPWVKDPPF